LRSAPPGLGTFLTATVGIVEHFLISQFAAFEFDYLLSDLHYSIFPLFPFS
jgi:hypothetical protein